MARWLSTTLARTAKTLSYTQCEAWLALYHGKRLIIAVPTEGAPRDARYQLIPDQRSAQQAHLQRLKQVERYPIYFESPDQLALEVLSSKVLEDLLAAGPARRIVHLPYRSLGDMFKGRDVVVKQLRTSLATDAPTGTGATVSIALCGLAGVGKTRLAVEYAWRYESEYSSLLFIGADNPEELQRNLAALCAPAILNLPEHKTTEESRQVAAVLAWLQRNVGWILILDNVDTQAAAQAVESLLPGLRGGNLLITSRLSNWSIGVEALALDVLDASAAVEFLLARTQAKRRKQADDAGQARTLAEELGCLAVALEQAGAFIAERRLSIVGYLTQWREQCDKVLAWYDPRLMKYPQSVATTLQTSFEHLGDPGRRLLRRLAWLSPEQVPESLLEISLEGPNWVEDPLAALAELEAYSLVSRSSDTPTFTVHALVQAITRFLSSRSVLLGTAQWMHQALKRLDQHERGSLIPHALAVAKYSDEAGFATPTLSIMEECAQLLHDKYQHKAAEPIMRRALAIAEASYGANTFEVSGQLLYLGRLLVDSHQLTEAQPVLRRALAIAEETRGSQSEFASNVVQSLASCLQDAKLLGEAEMLLRRAMDIDGHNDPTSLTNFAQFLWETDRLSEAEPLMRRALAIGGRKGVDAIVRLGNLGRLLRDTNRSEEAEPLLREALAITVAHFGDHHPEVAMRRYALAKLLQDANRSSDAEAQAREALQILKSHLGDQHSEVKKIERRLAAILQRMHDIPPTPSASTILVDEISSDQNGVRDNTC